MTTIDTSGVDWDAVHAEQERDCREPHPTWTAPRVLPPAFEEVQRAPTGAKYRARARNLVAIVSCAKERDGRWWLHLSVSHKSRVPTWDEFRWCKEVFIGDREAYQVLPPKLRYVNIHPYVLHMFALHDDGCTALPDFTRGTGSL